MTSRFSELVVDCRDPKLLADFWCEVLGYKILDEYDGLIEIGHEAPTAEGFRAGPLPPTIVFAPVPEGKTVKNRLHMDVSPIDAEHADEVERVIALGARRVDIGQGDVRWVVLADPEGNEFCILRSLAAT
ncbi:MAG: VOC family protein [Actinomycetota bacterium]